MVKNIQGESVNFSQVLAKSEKNQPTLIATWADSYCAVCEDILNEFKKHYASLKKEHNLRVITLNTDINATSFKKSYKRKHQNTMGPFKSITDFVKNYKGIKGWPYEKYIDEEGAFFKTAQLTGAPAFYLFYNNEVKFFRKGFYASSSLKSSDNPAKLKLSTSQLTASNLKEIIESLYATESYYDANWKLTLKDYQPTYKRTVLKEGNLYEITDSWITGEKQMRGLFKDKTGDVHADDRCVWYYKNGNKQSVRNFTNNKTDGAYVDYYENGTIKWKGNYKNGRYNGTWMGYYSNGNEMTKKNWENGSLASISFFKSKSGTTLLTNGTGLYIEYAADNSKNYEVSYVNNILNGSYTKYHPNGKIKIKGSYWEGKKDGLWEYFDDKGSKESQTKWDKGEIVKIKEPKEPKPILESTDEDEGDSGDSHAPAKEPKPFKIVETQPSFIGGKSALVNYLSRNVVYPKKSRKRGIEGKVIVEFLVAKTGMLKDIKIAKSVTKELDQEALRVVKSMPNWKPGTQQGKTVNVLMRIPISFKLQ